ncbi:MAG: thermonuclease family protein [Planctomycetia bacterium]
MASSPARLAWLLAALFLCVPQAARAAEPPAPAGTAVPRTAIALEDGDTLVVRLPGQPPERVQLLGLDAPELQRPEYDIPLTQPGAEQALGFVQGALDTALELRLLRAPARDAYGRTLAYLLADGQNVNALLIRAGLASGPAASLPDQGFPAQLAQCRAAAAAAGPPAFEEPSAYRRRMKALAQQQRKQGLYPALGPPHAGHATVPPPPAWTGASSRAGGTPEPLDKARLFLDDGDTLVVRSGSREVETIRILGLDTPEVQHFQHRIPWSQPFGEQAWGYHAGAVAVAGTVEVLRARDKDTYGRTLGYVYVNGRNLSVLAIRARLSGAPTDRFGDNGFPEQLAECKAAAKAAGPVAFEEPYLYRRRMRDVAEWMLREGLYPPVEVEGASDKAPAKPTAKPAPQPAAK